MGQKIGKDEVIIYRGISEEILRLMEKHHNKGSLEKFLEKHFPGAVAQIERETGTTEGNHRGKTYRTLTIGVAITLVSGDNYSAKMSYTIYS